MDEYSTFSNVYDLFMEDIPYKNWCTYLCHLLEEQQVKTGLVCELGCGTGSMTELLAQRGYDMTGIDRAEQMLQEALFKRDESGLPILYLLQDMREFELYGTMAAFVSVCDSMNYLLTEEDMLQTLKLVNNYLDPGGVFIFDLKTEHFFRDVLGEQTRAVTEDSAAYIWENYYDEEEKINQYALTLFEENPDGSYERSEELHEQRAWSVREIRKLSEEAGLLFVKAYTAFTEEEASEDSERIYIVLKEQGKEGQK